MPPAREMKKMIQTLGGYLQMRVGKSSLTHVPVPSDSVNPLTPLRKGGLLGERGAKGEEPVRDLPTTEPGGNHIGRRNDKTTRKGGAM